MEIIQEESHPDILSKKGIKEEATFMQNTKLIPFQILKARFTTHLAFLKQNMKFQDSC